MYDVSMTAMLCHHTWEPGQRMTVLPAAADPTAAAVPEAQLSWLHAGLHWFCHKISQAMTIAYSGDV
jgi:hypothetical protein